MTSTSVHMNRKAAVDDTAFNHKVHDLLAETNEESDSDDEVPQTKNQYFEFSNSYHVMRLIRLILFLQTLSILIDDPGTRLSLLFHAFCKGVLFYSIRLHSRVFIDALYVLQYFWRGVVTLVERQHLPTTPSSIEFSGFRRLNTNPYISDSSQSTNELFKWDINIVDQRNWHTIKFFSHYFLTIMFVGMSVLFLFRFWEITDYSDRNEVKKWLHKYIADGWWKRGGISFASSIAKGCIAIGLGILVLHSISRVFSAESLSNGLILTSSFAVFLSLTGIVWLCGYIGIKVTESAFVRFVSQNVAYTSVIILKRAVKAKFDLGLIFVISLYMPLLYTMLQSVLMFTDWNEIEANDFRKSINFFVPCYFMGFPPYRKSHMGADVCPVSQYSSPEFQLSRTQGFFQDSNILQCDSYFGLCLYLLSTITLMYALLGYFYMFFSMIDMAVKEFKTSRWTDVLDKLIRIRDEESLDYNERFSFQSRLYQGVVDEYAAQLKHCKLASIWMVRTFFEVMKSILLSVWWPLYFLFFPFKFLIERIIIICFFDSADLALAKKSRKINATKPSSLQLDQDNVNGGIGFDEGFDNVRESEELWSVSNKLNRHLSKFSQNLNLFDLISRLVKYGSNSIQKNFMKLQIVAYLRINFNILLHNLFNEARADGSIVHGLASLGGQHAPWRVDITLVNKTRLLHRMKKHVVTELRIAKGRFISDHELVISVLDYTVDSAGLMTLVILYDYHRMYWFLMVLFEMTVYAIFGALLKQYIGWVSRNYFFFATNVFFGMVTYAANPYTDDLDRWLEFNGRVLVGMVSVGVIIYAEFNLKAIEDTFIPMYKPWQNISLLYDTFFGFQASFTTIIDIAMVLFFYSYIIYILYAIGCFHVFERMVEAFQFGFHDHILDMLVENLDKRTYGFENIFSGLEFVQQWDDIIKSQRRYALLTWPDVRPANLASFEEKIFEIKWASLFNLTLKNLRSSLGLTVLHTTMFQADGDVSRWIIHTNPQLLFAQDSQNDSPITISLKECAYYLLLYGAISDGKLDDGTSYSDEDYATYYLEVDELRDEVFQNGEFISEQSIVHYLTSEDVVRLHENGCYKEPKYLTLEDQENLLREIEDKNSSYFVKKSNKGNAVVTKEQAELENAIKLQKRKNKLIDIRNQRERQSLTSKRFPEDDCFDYFESSTSTSWNILKYNIPQENIFLDPFIVKRMMKFPNFLYDNSVSVYKQNNNGSKERTDENDNSSDDESNEFDEINHTTLGLVDAKQETGDYSDPLNGFANKDLQYVVPGYKAVNMIGEKLKTPMDHPLLKDFIDWDQKRKRKFSVLKLGSSIRGSEKEATSDKSPSTGNQDNSISRFSLLNQQTAIEKRDRESRWKICKFAEILMSEEMSAACEDFRWSIIDFKSFNKLSSANQGKIAQQLAMVCHLNPPSGFVRVSDWSVGIPPTMYDERPEDNISMVVKGIITLISTVENIATTAIQVVSVVKNATDMSSKSKGRNRRRRATVSGYSISSSENNTNTNTNTNSYDPDTDMLSDRIVHYLAEALICSTKHLVLEDCELSYNGRRGWRAIARALRRQYASFVTPSIFVPPRQIILLTLKLATNELDCGDCSYITDIIFNQKSLEYVDLSFNRIGARGMNLMSKALRDHPAMKMFYINNNIIGPGAGKEIGIFLKYTKSLKLINLANNYLGEMVRFPTLYSREKLISAAHAICIGLRYNKSLEVLDLSYNHLGTSLAESLPSAINKHPSLHTLNIAGNDLGPIYGTRLIFLLGGSPNGMRYAKEREAFLAAIKQRQKSHNSHSPENEKSLTENAKSDSVNGDNNNIQSLESIFSNTTALKRKEKSLSSTQISIQHNQLDESSLSSEQLILALENSLENASDSSLKPAMNLTSINFADNQLGDFSGHAIAALLDGIKGLTHLDLSGNSLGPIGGERVCDELELCYGIKPREFLKLVLFNIEERKYTTGRNPKQRKKKYTNLVALNMSRNNLGPKVVGSLMYCLKNLNCGIIQLDISRNPLGQTTKEVAGDVVESSLDIRHGLMNNCSLTELNLNETSFLSNNLVTIFGGLAYHEIIQKLVISNVSFDEPCCLQLSNVLQRCGNLTHLDIQNNSIGANGGLIISQKLMNYANQFRYINLSDNHIGPVSAIYLGEAIKKKDCTIRVLKLKNNSIMEDGGLFLAKSLSGNSSITDLDLSCNQLTFPVALYLADALRGFFVDGVKVRDSALKKLSISDNPLIGHKGSRIVVKSLSNQSMEHLEINNIGAGPGTADLIAFGLRDPSVSWRYLSASGNNFSRIGMNQIFWALRQNKLLRVLNVGENGAGKNFTCHDDALLKHGIALPVSIRNNVVLRVLDLSYNSIVSEAGINIFDAIIDNHTIKKLSLRGNLLDDSVAVILPDLLKCNNVLESLDLGYNKLGFASAYAIAEALEINRSLKLLLLDHNLLGNGGAATIDQFCRGLMTNYTLQVFVLDNNKLGPQFGIKFAETIVRNRTLVQLSLKDNHFDTRAGLALLKAYKNNSRLLELALTADEIGVDLWEEFSEIFQQKRASVHPGNIFSETNLSVSQSTLLQKYGIT